MTITLPDEPVRLEMSEAQLRIELACALYAGSQVSRGTAERIAGLGYSAFCEELYRRKIPWYTEEMYEMDLQYIKERFAQD